MAIPAHHVVTCLTPRNLTPLQAYDDDLIEWLTASAGTADSGTEDFTWTGQKAATVFTENASDDDYPAVISPSQNGFDGVDFQATASDNVGKKVFSSSAIFDNFWSGAGNKNAAFAARIDTLTFQGSLTRSVIMAKGVADGSNNGWQFYVSNAGDLVLRWENTGGARFSATVSSFYSAGDLVLGHVTFDGIFSGTPNLVVRLWDNDSPGDFITVAPTISNPGGTIGDDSAVDFTIGNNEQAGFNEPWMGDIFDVWLTKPARTSINEAFLKRYVVP